MLSYKDIVLRLIISLLLSSLIGIDRESTKKPAGLRTHVLVCVSSTLVMLLSIFILENYSDSSSIQPDRLGAQVISGIGFLGAGTIIREGSTVKGLTTAASLWAVACIGLAIGSGFYFGGILATLLVLLTLITFSRFNRVIKSRENLIYLQIKTLDKPGQLGKIGHIIGEFGMTIDSVDLEKEENNLVKINIDIKIDDVYKKWDLLNALASIEYVVEVSQRD